MNPSFFYFILLFLLSLFWGTSFIIMKFASQNLGPFTIACYRLLVGGLILFVIWGIQNRFQGIQKKDWIYIVIGAITGNVIPFCLQPYLIYKTDNSSFIGMMVIFVPLFTILASFPILKISPNRRELTGTVVGLLGLLFLIKDGLDKNILLSFALLAFVAPLFYAVTNTFIKKFLSHIPPIALASTITLLGGLILFPLSFFYEKHLFLRGDLTSWGSLIFLGVFCTGLPIFCFYFLILKIGPLRAGLVTYLIPLVALLWGYRDGESISFIQILITLGVIGMVYYAQTHPSKKPEHI